MINKTTRTSKAQKTIRKLLGFFLIFAGIGHLTFMRTAFLAQVPNWVPMDADLVVLLSGVVELILGTFLIFLTKRQTMVGWTVALFFVAVFSGNIAQLVNHNYAFGLNSDLFLWLRLPFQPVLIWVALWSTGAWAEWRRERKLNQQAYYITQ